MALIAQIALMSMLLVLDAQAAEPKGTLTLTCKGTEEIRSYADTASIRVIIDFRTEQSLWATTCSTSTVLTKQQSRLGQQ
jgi:hypothetical protein